MKKLYYFRLFSDRAVLLGAQSNDTNERVKIPHTFVIPADTKEGATATANSLTEHGNDPCSERKNHEHNS